MKFDEDRKFKMDSVRNRKNKGKNNKAEVEVKKAKGVTPSGNRVNDIINEDLKKKLGEKLKLSARIERSGVSEYRIEFVSYCKFLRCKSGKRTMAEIRTSYFFFFPG